MQKYSTKIQTYFILKVEKKNLSFFLLPTEFWSAII